MSSGRCFSLILLPVLDCNAACSYCFENKRSDRLSVAQFAVLLDKVLTYLEQQQIGELTIYWQGGEALLLSPDWYARAHEVSQLAAQSRNMIIRHSLQTNLLAYSEQWDDVIAAMFGNCVGTSMDYPNLHRHIAGHSPAHYTALWLTKVREAQAAGITVQVIAVANPNTLTEGAERFYRYFVEALGITDFQINTPFAGGTANAVKRQLPLPVEPLSRFYQDLALLWSEEGYANGVRIGPFDALLDYFTHREACLPCIWSENCINTLLCIDARGYLAQCDCWVTSYPDYRYGNIFTGDSLAALLRTSPARRRFDERPITLIQRECITCEYLALCHGGCPIRTYSAHHTLSEKDPYCRFYQALFECMATMATRLSRRKSRFAVQAD